MLDPVPPQAGFTGVTALFSKARPVDSGNIPLYRSAYYEKTNNIRSKGDTDDGGLYCVFHGEERTHAVMNRCEGTEIYREMDIDYSRDHVVFKNRYSPLLSNPRELRDKLEALGRTQLLIAGIAANVCVESTLRDAMQLDYEVILVSDGTTAPDDAAMKNTLTNTRLFFGDVQTADETAANLMNKSS